jgi:hypothetical protein
MLPGAMGDGGVTLIANMRITPAGALPRDLARRRR